jgi:hypothetical protein
VRVAAAPVAGRAPGKCRSHGTTRREASSTDTPETWRPQAPSVSGVHTDSTTIAIP